MKQKKLLALLLAVCMVLALLPTFAAAEATAVTDALTRATTGVNSSSYSGWTYTSNASGVVYSGQSAGGNDSIQLRSKYSNSGIVTTASGCKAMKIVVVWNDNTQEGQTLDVYGNNTAYSAPTDLYGSNAGTKIASIVKDTSTELTIDDEYAYIGLRSNNGALYLTEIDITWEKDGDTPQPTTYKVSFDANGGTGTMADVTTTSPYTLPTCAFTAPEGQEFDYWAIDGDEGMYDPGDEYELTGDTTFVAQWKDLPVPTYTNMKLKRVPANEDVVVIYYPATSKVMTGKDYLDGTKHKLTPTDATLTDDELAVPDEALRLTVTTTVADDGETTLYTFATEDGRYLLADGTHVQLVDEQGANTLFQLKTAGTDNWYIKCDSATYGGNDQYIEYFRNYFTVYKFNSSYTQDYTFQFFAENGEGPTPEATYIVSFDAGEGSGTMEDVEATNPYTLPECTFTAPDGCVFDGWMMADGDGDVYPAGAQVTLEEPNVTFIAQWKELVARNYQLVTSDEDLVDGETYLIASELFVDELYLMSNQAQYFRNDYKVSNVEGNTITLDETWIATNASDALAFEFTLVDAEDGWAFYDEVTGGYLAAVSSSSNYMGTQETLDDNGVFSISYADESGAIVPVAQGTYTRNYLRYNGDYNRFSCYASTSSLDASVYLYKLVEDEPVELEDGFYLIGPNWTVNAIDPAEKFGENVNAGGEFILAATLAVGDEIKVVKVASGAITDWYPDGEDTQYTVDAAHAGNVNIYFRETYNSDWAAFGGYFYIEAGYNITCVSGEHGLVSTTHSRAAEGTTVTIYLEAEDDYEVDTLTVMCGETEVETNKVNNWQYNFLMPAGDVTITATFAIPAAEPYFRGQNLILDGLIGVSFNMELPAISGVDYTTSYMTFSIKHGECTKRAEYNEDASFACYVSAIQMAEPITATFHYTQNGTEKTIEKTYSIENYFTAFEAIADQYDDTTVALVHAVADYGYYAQHFLAEQKGWTFGTDYVEMETVYSTSYNVNAVTTAVADDAIVRETNADITQILYTLVLDSATEIRVLFKTVSGYSGEFALNEPYTATAVGANYQVSVLNIPAHLLSEKHTIIATTDAGEARVVVSAMSYVKTMLDTYTDATAQYSAAAIYAYSQAADAYQAAH